MLNNSMQQALTSLAWLGTAAKTPKLEDYPAELQPVISKIMASAADPENAFYQIVNVAVAYQQSLEELKLNSFSLEQMEKLQRFKSTLAQHKQSMSAASNDGTSSSLGTAGGASTLSAASPDTSLSTAASTSSATSLPTTATTAATMLAQSESDPELEQLLAKFNMHTWPKPLPESANLTEKIMPDEISQMLLRIADLSCADFLLWFLRKLGKCPYVMDAKYIVSLGKLFYATNKFHLKTAGQFYLAPDFMIRELLYKFGGSGLRYMLPHLDREATSAFLYSPYLEDGDLNYDLLFEKGTAAEKLGMFLKLRWSDPELSREIFTKYQQDLSADERADFVCAFDVNLSLDDEPLLMKLIKMSRIKRIRDYAVYRLRNLRGSHYAQLCAQQARNCISYDETKGWNIETFAYTDELKALGVIDPKDAAVTKGIAREMVKDLLWGMELEDILKFTGKTDKLEALELLIKSNEPRTKTALFTRTEFNFNLFMLRKLALSGDQQLIQYVLENNLLDVYTTRDSTTLLLLMHVVPEERNRWLDKLSNIMDWRYGEVIADGWFALSDGKPNSPLDFVPINEDWAKTIIKHIVNKIYYDGYGELPYECAMYLPYSVIPWLDELVQKRQERLEELEKLQEKHKDNPVRMNDLYKKHYNCSSSIKFLERLVHALTLKQQAEQLISTSLPEYYAADLSKAYPFV